MAKNNFDYQKNVKEGRLNKFVSKSLAAGGGGGGGGGWRCNGEFAK